MGRPLKIKKTTTTDIGFNIFSLLDTPTQVIPAGMTSSQYLGVVGGGYPSGVATPTFPTVASTAFFPNSVGETAAYILTQKGSTKYQVASNNTVNAGSFGVGFSYVIKAVGNTNWASVGASSSAQVGDVFTATAVGAGTGTVSSVTTCALANVAAGALAAGQMQITVTTTAGSFRISKLSNKYAWNYNGTVPGTRYAANFFVAGGAANPLTTVAITGIAGQFSCGADTLAVGQALTISGTFGGTGSIVGYANPTTYYIIATNGTTTFTLSATPGGAAITTTAGTPTGLTYSMAGSVTAKSGAEIDTWTNATGNLDLAEVSDYTS